jgi:hypothetical protein
MHQMHVALELKDQELQGLKTALESKKKRSKKKKVLLLSPRDPNVQGGAIFWDPASKACADRRMRDAEKQEIAEAAAKANKKQLQYNTKLLREKTKAENKETRQRSVRRLLKRGPKKLVKRRNVRLKKHALRHSRTRKKYLNRLNMQGARPQRSRSQKYPKVVVVQRDVVYRWLMSLAWHP